MDQLFIDFDQIMGLTISTLFAIVMIISLEVIGLVQFCKNFIHSKNGHKKWEYSLLSLVLCAGCSVMNTALVDPIITRIFNFCILSLSTVQMCWDVIVKSFPKAVQSILDKNITSQNSSN